MQLALQFNPHIKHPVAAAFIQGATPGIWLREINDWGIAVEQLTCFIVPQQFDKVAAAGLLVIFPQGKAPAANSLRYPYGVVAGKLFLPVHADLTPVLTLPELQELLVWDYQLYHPSIGFVGFETADRLSLADLLAWPAPLDNDWTFAHTGLPAPAPLEEVSVQRLNAASVFESLQESVGHRPLTDIIPEREKEQDRSIPSKLLGMLLRPLFLLAQNLYRSKPPVTSSSTPYRQEERPITGKPRKRWQWPWQWQWRRPRWVQRIESWVEMRMEELMAKRDSELQRLMKLFDTDPDEALQYAIPLGDPYMGRGEAPPSAQLDKRPTNFDLSRLGGGQPIDNWNVGNYYSDLRQKYQQAAEKELAAGNYKKAAYIYAHLLGNYQAAAQALEQGRYYREAAALYKEHIKNLPAAAACLEKGGLYLEAIELYDSLLQHEQAGDLYMRMEQREQAAIRYERCIEYALNHQNLLDAARIMEQKLQQPERAKQNLMQGWQDNRQAVSCLTRYFEMTAADKEAGPLEDHVRQVFDQETPASRHIDFLSVLMAVHKQYSQPELTTTAADITYEVIGKQLSEDDISNIALLQHFIPEDRLLPVDLQRFTANRKPLPKPRPAVTSFQLARDTRWVGAVSYGAQLLILGVKDTGMYLVRANEEGKLEYHLWSMPVEKLAGFTFLSNPSFSDNVYLQANIYSDKKGWKDGTTVGLQDKLLTQTPAFPKKIPIKCPTWLPKNLLGFGLSPDGHIFTVHVEDNHHLTLRCYSVTTGLRYVNDCRIAGDSMRFITAPAAAQEMICRDNYFYLYYGEYVLRVTFLGEMQATRLKGSVIMLADSTIDTATTIVAATEAGCVLLVPTQYNMNVQQHYFAAGQGIKAVCYVPGGLVVVAGPKHAAVYSMKDIHGKKDEPFMVINTDSAIVAVRTISKRHHCAIIEENGRVSIHYLLHT
ncbi:hypothetical protein F0L74_06300 [Chitinophaga agrisoli]|uniref:MoxR-vWA-beta-propeller ternary system domain-containing protein n=1 Tax=Chitinophaga agrisoli TaxID=2607653 RepID=A0A5B2W0M8_9BACT|nr:hypothetical protein [Chitinophaga agrisoli]KAA2245563.1 hypothetical protein F0L74_06300 [Chitinophaga agrisoli]